MKRALLLAALLVPAWVRTGSAQGTDVVIAHLASYEGSLDVVRRGFPLMLYAELPLVSADQIVTHDGKAVVRFEDKTEFRLRKNSKITISEQINRRDIDVFFGRLWASIISVKGRQTSVKSGGTIAAVRGTKIEFAGNADGSLEVGVIEGELEVSVRMPDGTTVTVKVAAGQMIVIPKDGAPSDPKPFKEGDIADRPDLSQPKPPAEPDFPNSGIKPDAEKGETQGQYAMRLINELGLGAALPPNATVRDVIDFFEKLGIYPADGHWTPDKEMTLIDYQNIAGYDTNDPDAPLLIPLEDMISRILERFSQLFWVQTQKRVTVSAFAP